MQLMAWIKEKMVDVGKNRNSRSARTGTLGGHSPVEK